MVWSGISKSPSSFVYPSEGKSERKESLSNGEISIVIPARSSDEKYLLKVNPFHNTWAEAHNEKCEAIPLPTLFPDKFIDDIDLLGDDI
jgi:hypothetical protein